MSKKKILVIGMANSIHLNKWLSLFRNTNHDFLIFPSTVFKKPNEEYIKYNKTFLLNSTKKFKLFHLPYSLLNFLFLKIDHLIFKRFFKKYFLGRVINKFKPDFIHTIEFQNAGYLYDDYLKKNHKKKVWILTNWGSDINYFINFDFHKKKIKRLLSLADKYSAECLRDYNLAKKYGFKGNNLPCFPNSGGINYTFAKKYLPNSFSEKEKIILVKGYQSIFSNASLVIKALGKLHKMLLNYKIIFFSCDDRLTPDINNLIYKYNLNVNTISQKRPIKNIDMMKLYSKSLIIISNSLSDGISTSMLEAMSMGVFPVQSNASCFQSWINHKKNGYIFKKNSIRDLIKGIEFSLIENDILKNSFHYNKKLVFKNANYEKLKKKALVFYE